MGNTVHRTLPGTPGAAPRGGAERLVLPGSPQLRSPGASRSLAAQARSPEPHPCGAVRPCLVLLALAVRPTPLFQPEVADERAGGGHRGFPRSEPFGGTAGHGCPGSPRTAHRRPRHTCYFLAAFPRAPGCAPIRCPLSWGPSKPHLSRCCRAHRPLVKSALEFPRPEKGGGRGA